MSDPRPDNTTNWSRVMTEVGESMAKSGYRMDPPNPNASPAAAARAAIGWNAYIRAKAQQ